MNILLCLAQKEAREMLSFALESKFTGLKFLEAESVAALDAHLKGQTKINLIVCDDSRGSDTVLDHLIALKSAVPCAVCGVPKADATENAFKDLKKFEGLVSPVNLLEELTVIVEKLRDSRTTRAIKEEKITEKDYCRIKTDLLLKVSPLKADIYIRLSDVKFIKLFKEGDVFDLGDFERYVKQKNVQYLFLKTSETGEFVDKFKANLLKMLSNDLLTEKKVREVSESVHETVQELITRMGATKEVQELVKANIQISMKFMGQNPRLSQIVERLKRDKTKYISSHSMMLGHLSCTIAAAMQWNSDTTYHKLNLAAFLHDITLTNNDLAAIQTLKELDLRQDEFTVEEVAAFKKHPVEAAAMAKQFQEVPPDVDVIIVQHHETADGTGFPRGLSHTRISPLASAFIIAHDLLVYIFKNDDKWTMQAFTESVKEKYSSGNFKKIIKTLSEVTE